MTAPDRSLQQRRAALDRANEIRTMRANLKRTLHDTARPEATRAVAAIVRDVPPWLRTMHAGELLLAIPGVGAVAGGQLLREVAISPRKSLDGLSERQRRELAQSLDALAQRRMLQTGSPAYEAQRRAAWRERARVEPAEHSGAI